MFGHILRFVPRPMLICAKQKLERAFPMLREEPAGGEKEKAKE